VADQGLPSLCVWGAENKNKTKRESIIRVIRADSFAYVLHPNISSTHGGFCSILSLLPPPFIQLPFLFHVVAVVVVVVVLSLLPLEQVPHLLQFHITTIPSFKFNS